MAGGGDVFLAAFLVFSAATFALIFWVAYCYRPPSAKKSFFKTLSAVLLAASSLLLVGPWWLTAALVFCAVGDYLLSLDRERAFLAGVAAFAVGHICYIGAFLGHPVAEFARLATFPAGMLAAVLVVLALGMAGVLFRYAGTLRFAVLGYVPIIGCMGLAALTVPMVGPLAIAVFGAGLFIVSDFILALEMFVLKEQSFAKRIAPFGVWSTYWLAQAALLIGLGLPGV